MDPWNDKIRSGEFPPDLFLVFIKYLKRKYLDDGQKIAGKKEDFLKMGEHTIFCLI